MFADYGTEFGLWVPRWGLVVIVWFGLLFIVVWYVVSGDLFCLLRLLMVGLVFRIVWCAWICYLGF